MSEQRAHGHWTIRSAAEADIAAVLDLWVAAGSLPSVSDSREGVARLLATDPQALMIAELGGVVVGSLIAAWDGWRGSFYRLAVSPDHRRQGLATMLLREGERRLRERGAVRLTAIVADDKGDAMSFWGTLVSTGRPRELIHAMLAAAEAQIRNPWTGRELAGLLVDAGLTDVTVQAEVLLVRDLYPDVIIDLPLLADDLRAQGHEGVEELLAAAQEDSREGRTVAALTLFTAHARVP